LIGKLATEPALLAQKIASVRDYRAWNVQANQHLPPVIDGLLITM